MSWAESTPEASEQAARVEHLRALIDRTRPVSLAEQRVLPVLPALEGLVPGLQRGSVVSVDGQVGATTLALALAAGPTRSGSWAAVVGLPELGWASALEAGVELDRVVVVRPGDRERVTVVAALADAFDVVLCGFDGAVSATEARRLAARVRERGSVLVVLGGRTGGVGRARRGWPGAPDARFTVVGSGWEGLGEGWGNLRERRVTVEVTGRRSLARPRRVELLLPDRSGTAAAPTEGAVPTESAAPTEVGVATVTPLRRVG